MTEAAAVAHVCDRWRRRRVESRGRPRRPGTASARARPRGGVSPRRTHGTGGGEAHHARELLRRAGHDATRKAASGRPVPDGHGVNTAHMGRTTSTPQIRRTTARPRALGTRQVPGLAQDGAARQCRHWGLDNGDVATAPSVVVSVRRAWRRAGRHPRGELRRRRHST